MFWTNLIKVASKIILTAEIIVSVFGGLALIGYSTAFGIIILCRGILMSLSAALFLMTISETSFSLYEINSKMRTTNVFNEISNIYDSQTEPIQKLSLWTCPQCGQINPSSSKICMRCEFQK